jgi:catalase
VNYWGVHAFTLTNAAGDSKVVKFKAIPAAGEVGLTDDEAKAKPADFYADELKERLGKGAAACDAFTFQPAKLPDGIKDPANDPIFAARPGADTLSLIRRSQ